jgi:hypothetical protein
MPERNNRRGWQFLAEQPGKQGEVIVLHKYDWVRTLSFACHDIGEATIDRIIAIPICLPEGRLDKRKMA